MHLAKHFPNSKGKKKEVLLKGAMDIVKKLTVSSLKETFSVSSCISFLCNP